MIIYNYSYLFAAAALIISVRASVISPLSSELGQIYRHVSSGNHYLRAQPPPTPTAPENANSDLKATFIRAAGPGSTELSKSFPAAAGTSAFAAAQIIKAGTSFDGKLVQFDRRTSTCNGQAEGGDSDAVFLLEDGATLSNVLIGPNNGEGVHCKGTCTLNNVWWVDVCEDAATFKQKSGTSYVNGGGARSGSDKILQHNGGGTVAVKNFFAQTSGKLYRSCGNCKTMYKRTSSFTNVYVDGLGVLAGVNRNYGDVVTVRDSCVLRTKSVCNVYDGNNLGAEPSLLSSGADGVNCIMQNVKTSGC